MFDISSRSVRILDISWFGLCRSAISRCWLVLISLVLLPHFDPLWIVCLFAKLLFWFGDQWSIHHSWESRRELFFKKLESSMTLRLIPEDAPRSSPSFFICSTKGNHSPRSAFNFCFVLQIHLHAYRAFFSLFNIIEHMWSLFCFICRLKQRKFSFQLLSFFSPKTQGWGEWFTWSSRSYLLHRMRFDIFLNFHMDNYGALWRYIFLISCLVFLP